MAGSSETYHEPYDLLSSRVKNYHRALTSLQEELEAIDWYRQRAETTDDGELREILLHNLREEMEHAAMILEWLRRNDSDLDERLRTYLFTDAPLTTIEKKAEAAELAEAEGVEALAAAEIKKDEHAGVRPPQLTIGKMKRG